MRQPSESVTVTLLAPTQPPPPFEVEQETVIGHAQSSGQSRNPPIIGSYLYKVANSTNRNKNSDRIIVVVCGPIESPFNADDEVVELIVAPDLAAPDKDIVVITVVEVEAEDAVALVVMGPGSPKLPPM